MQYFAFVKLILCFFFWHRQSNKDTYDSDMMAKEFLCQFAQQAFTVGQQLAFDFNGKQLLSIVIKDLEGK